MSERRGVICPGTVPLSDSESESESEKVYVPVTKINYRRDSDISDSEDEKSDNGLDKSGNVSNDDEEFPSEDPEEGKDLFLEVLFLSLSEPSPEVQSVDEENPIDSPKKLTSINPFDKQLGKDDKSSLALKYRATMIKVLPDLPKK